MAMIRKQKAVTHGLRYNAELNNRIDATTKKGGFSSHSAFIRAAIERELAGRESGVDARRNSGSLRVWIAWLNLRIAQQAVFAFVDVLTKTFLTVFRNRRGMCTTKPSPAARLATTGFLRG